MNLTASDIHELLRIESTIVYRLSVDSLTFWPLISLDIILCETWIELSEVFDKTFANNYSVYNISILQSFSEQFKLTKILIQIDRSNLVLRLNSLWGIRIS